MIRKMLIAAVGALGLAAAVGCEREEGQRPGGTTAPERRDQPTQPPPTTPETTPPSEPQTPPDRPEDRPQDRPQQETPR